MFATSELLISSTRDWASAVALWNLALYPQGGPAQSLGYGCEGCTGVVSVDPQTGQYTLSRDYYQLAQFSRFISPGAVRISSPHFVSYRLAVSGTSRPRSAPAWTTSRSSIPTAPASYSPTTRERPRSPSPSAGTTARAPTDPTARHHHPAMAVADPLGPWLTRSTAAASLHHPSRQSATDASVFAYGQARLRARLLGPASGDECLPSTLLTGGQPSGRRSL